MKPCNYDYLIEYEVYNGEIGEWAKHRLCVTDARSAEAFIVKMDSLYKQDFKFLSWVKV